MMKSSGTVKDKLVQVILNLARRSIDEARKVPYWVEQDNVVDILINHPDLYKTLVSEGQLEGDGVPQGKMLVKLDILAEIEEFRSLDKQLVGAWGSGQSKIDLESVSSQVNSLTKLFLAYHGNMVAIFEKEYDHFLGRFRKTLDETEEELHPFLLDQSDFEEARQMAEAYLAEQRFIEAFSLGKLFHPDIIRNLLFQFPDPEYSLVEELIRESPKIEPAYSNLVRFILRACYLSHSLWCDLFVVLLKLVEQDPGLYHRQKILELVEQDIVFCCNLLHTTYDQLHSMSAEQRRAAIEASLHGHFS